MAIYDDKLIVATSDAHVVALDAKSGKVVWDHETADWSKGWRYTGGPFIVNGKVIQGMTGCGNAEPGGCFITGHDIKTGDRAVAGQHHRPSRRSQLRHLERLADGKPLRRLGLDFRQL